MGTRAAIALTALLSAVAGAGMALAIVAGDREAGPAVGRPGTHPGAGDVVTLLDYYEAGRGRVDAFLAGRPDAAGLRDVIERVRDRVVRVHTIVAREGEAVETVRGSGVLIRDGTRLLSAGHGFDRDGEVRVLTTSGRSLPARLGERSHEVFGGPALDWAVLDLEDPPGEGLDLGEIRAGRIVFAFGYPAGIGIGAGGRVVDGGMRQVPLMPLCVVARVRSVEPLDVVPLAGAIPLGGMSGGPVVDAGGDVVGVFVSVRRTPLDGGGRRIRLGVAPIPARLR